MRNRKPNRLKTYNYSHENLYFVTICVYNNVACFGEIGNTGIIHLNAYREIATKQWDWLINQYPYLTSHAFVVMPNHVHGVLEINHNRDVGTGRDMSNNEKQDNNTNSGQDRLLQNENNNDDNSTSPDLSLQKIKPLSELIGAFKTTSSKQIHIQGYNDFKWQRSFHCLSRFYFGNPIIRNDNSAQRIIDYINENPLKWENEKYFMNIEHELTI